MCKSKCWIFSFCNVMLSIIQFVQNFMFWARCNVFFSKLFFIDNYRSNINTVVYKD